MKIFITLLLVSAVALGSKVPRLDGRIVGGEEVTIEEYPHQVSVRYGDSHICGGSILDKYTILTAAHCVYDMNHSRYSIRAGSPVHSLGIQHEVSEVRMNKDYDPDATDNDMAILKLKTALTFRTAIQPIGLQRKGVEVEAGTQAWVSGWGAIKEGDDETPRFLRAVDVSVITNNDCASKYGPGNISSHMMCAQTLGHDSCQGDSGGPLIADGKLIGVVSWGYGCARPQYPGVYAKVSDMYDWIIENK